MTYHTFEIARMRLASERKLMTERYELRGRLLAGGGGAAGHEAPTARPPRRAWLTRPVWQALMRVLAHGTQLSGT